MIDPYKNYKDISINTMTKGEQLILLFDKAIQRMVAACTLLDEQKTDEASVFISRTIDIFNYLMVCLDKKFEFSRELVEIYAYINGQLILSRVNKKKDRIEAILPIVRDLRDTWAEADRLARVSR